MNPEMIRAATEAAARFLPPRSLYRRCFEKSTAINDILAGLLFGLAGSRLTSAEQTTVLDKIDGLVSLKTDAGLLRGVRHGG
jgi:hypothetical protein